MNDNQEQLDIEEPEDSLTADLAAAWDAAESTEEEVQNEVARRQEPAHEEEAIEPTQESEEQPAESPDPAADEPAELPQESEKLPDTENPPVTLTPAAREAWKDTPDAIRKEIAKRERDYEEGIRKNKENANRALQMDSVLQPYEELFRQDGGRPAQTINGLLQTASALAKGGEHAANVVAHLVRQFNVPIDALDDRLSQSIGATPAPRQEPGLSPAHIEQMVEQSIAKREQQFQMQQVGSELQQFANDPKNEFYNDVRGTMSTYLRVQAEQGQPVDLQGAYDWACKADPEISKILMARQAAPTAAQRRASKSITGNMGGSAPAQTAGTLREQLEQQFNDLGIG